MMALGADMRDLTVEPHAAGEHFFMIRTLVNAALPSSLPLEVFDRVRDVDIRWVNARLDQCVTKDAAGGPHKRLAGFVFGITRLLTDEHQLRGGRTLAKDGLG